MVGPAPSVPLPANEPVLTYAPGLEERALLKRELGTLTQETVEIPLVIAGRAITTGDIALVRSPHNRRLVLGRCHQGGAADVERAIEAAVAARGAWAAAPYASRAAVFLKAAELLATKYRPVLNGATMLGQSKTAHQAEIDAACELIDFWRFNVAFGARIAEQQPMSPPGFVNTLEARPLEGFVLAVTPFNFTAIAGNLPTAPALMGNTVLWKPAASAAFSAHFIMQILIEAGLPDGVINLVFAPPAVVSDVALASPALAGIHFTGSTPVFQKLWRTVGERVASYRTYPRLVGETGGKDFVFVHPSADLDALTVALVRGAYEYQGQKCSAASRAYVPASVWPALRERLVGMIGQIRVGDVSDFSNFMGAVIDERAFEKIGDYVDGARIDSHCKILAGGGRNSDVGYFIEPTLVETTDPHHRLMTEEIFGPVLTVWVYPDARYDEALALCERSSPYALTGAFFAQDRAAIDEARAVLRFAAGNLYINDKPTGAVVGQQPFGGARASGTNDKAGSIFNLYRWVSPRIIKETFAPPVSFAYPFMREV